MNHEWKSKLEDQYGIGVHGSNDNTGPLRIPLIVKADADGAFAALCEAMEFVAIPCHRYFSTLLYP